MPQNIRSEAATHYLLGYRAGVYMLSGRVDTRWDKIIKALQRGELSAVCTLGYNDATHGLTAAFSNN